MNERLSFLVGGHTFSIETPKGFLSEKELQPYSPFRTVSSLPDKPLFTLQLLKESEPFHLPDSSNPLNLKDENGYMNLFSEDNGTLCVVLQTTSSLECCRLRISTNFRHAVARITGSSSDRQYALDTTLMMLFAFASAQYNTLLIHASAIEYKGGGYIFLGKSGTGKTTHSRLWVEHIFGSQLLNDDNPVIRIVDNEIFVYGSPWSGKTKCYRNKRLPLKGIVRLRQAPYNRISPIHSLQAYADILPSCSSLKWDHEMADSVHLTLSKIISKVPFFRLEALPNKEAALLCRDSVVNTSETRNTELILNEEY